MGTSQSSNGSPGGVPMVPPWVPEIEDGTAHTADPTTNPEPSEPDQSPVQATSTPIAPSARFGAARTNVGRFATTGNIASLRRGVGQYVRHGYGGSGTATRRLGNTVATAGSLYTALSNLASGQPGLADPDLTILRGASASVIMDAVVEAVRPVDGTQDAEANRKAVRDSLSELLTRFPEADLLNLNEEQQSYATEQFVALDVFQRFTLDLGKHIQDKSASAAIALSRLKQARDYIRQTVAASFRALRSAGRTFTSKSVRSLVTDALHEAMEVFEGYAR